MSHATTVVHAAAAATSGGFDPLTIGLVVLLAVMVIFMFRNSRKRKRDAEELQNKFIPGAEVMTQHGIYGTLISIDDDKNEAIIETTPGTRLRVHRQTISRVIDPVEAQEDVIEEPAGADLSVPETPVVEGEPEYGERTESAAEKPKRAPRKKPAE